MSTYSDAGEAVTTDMNADHARQRANAAEDAMSATPTDSPRPARPAETEAFIRHQIYGCLVVGERVDWAQDVDVLLDAVERLAEVNPDPEHSRNFKAMCWDEVQRAARRLREARKGGTD